MSAPRLILERAHVSLGRQPALAGVDLIVSPGEVVALVGPNGAGKTTALRALCGLLTLDSGTAQVRLVDDALIDPVRAHPQARARALGYLAQERTSAWDLPVIDLVALGRFAYGAVPERLGAHDAQACARALGQVGLTGFEERRLASLSGGERARAHLARLLASEAPALIADEPGASLDPAHQEAMMACLKARAEHGAACLVAVHDLALAARWCDRVVVMAAGRVVADAPPRDALSPQVLADVFAVRGSWIDAPAWPAALVITGRV